MLHMKLTLLFCAFDENIQLAYATSKQIPYICKVSYEFTSLSTAI